MYALTLYTYTLLTHTLTLSLSLSLIHAHTLLTEPAPGGHQADSSEGCTWKTLKHSTEGDHHSQGRQWACSPSL